MWGRAAATATPAPPPPPPPPGASPGNTRGIPEGASGGCGGVGRPGCPRGVQGCPRGVPGRIGRGDEEVGGTFGRARGNGPSGLVPAAAGSVCAAAWWVGGEGRGRWGESARIDRSARHEKQTKEGWRVRVGSESSAVERQGTQAFRRGTSAAGRRQAGGGDKLSLSLSATVPRRPHHHLCVVGTRSWRGTGRGSADDGGTAPRYGRWRSIPPPGWGCGGRGGRARRCATYDAPTPN